MIEMVAICRWREAGRTHLKGELRKFEEPNGRDAELNDLNNEQAVAFLGVKAAAGTREC